MCASYEVKIFQQALLCNAAVVSLGESILLGQTCLFGADGEGNYMTWVLFCRIYMTFIEMFTRTIFSNEHNSRLCKTYYEM
jgi:hypothetical protein